MYIPLLFYLFKTQEKKLYTLTFLETSSYKMDLELFCFLQIPVIIFFHYASAVTTILNFNACFSQ